MNSPIDTAADDVHVEQRIQPIHVSTQYLGRYQSVNRVRDLPDFYIDEPVELGGKNAGPTALETTLAALNSCSAMIMFVLRREMSFDLKGVRFEADGHIDVRRVEMKRTGKRYSEVVPIADHYQRVVQRVFIQTSEPDARMREFQSEVERLCPMHALLRDAKVPVESIWIRE
ncbi:OsmC family peroxiredoxin [bacterium]|nr:MAG: OsmC family peroxiredoxin [bacterium]